MKWFGPALNEAHDYESNLAVFPRVILAPSMVKKIKSHVDLDQKNKTYRNLFLGDDGFYWIDYLGWIHLSFNDDYIKAHEEIKLMITSSLNLSLPNKAKTKWNWFKRYFNKYTEEILLPHYGDKVNLVEN